MDGWRVSYDTFGNVYIEITSDGNTYEWELTANEVQVFAEALIEALRCAESAVDSEPQTLLA